MSTPATWKGEPLRLTMAGTPILVWQRFAGAPPVMIYNFDQNNIVYAGYTSNIAIGGPNTQIIPPNFGLTMDGNRAIYVVGVKGAGPVQITPGGGAPFQLGTINIFATPATNVVEDASTPAVVNVASVSGPSGTTASFSPPANSWLIAIVNVGAAGAETPSLTVSDTGGHTWTQAVNNNDGGGHFSSIWRAPITSAPGSITVTAHNTDVSVITALQLAVRVVTSANANQAGAGTASNSGNQTSVTGAITTTKGGSLVYCAAGTNGTTLTAISGTTGISDFADAGVGDHLLAGKATANTIAAGATTFGWTASPATQFVWAALEVIP